MLCASEETGVSNTTTSTEALAETKRTLREELHRFVANDPGRSVALEVLDEPRVRLDMAGDTKRPAASLVKVLLAIALYEGAGRGEFDLGETVGRGDLGSTMYPSVLAAFADDRQLTLREVCAFSLLTSDNPAAEYLRELVGMERAAAVGQKLGLEHSTFAAGFGDEALADNAANVTTAKEALRLFLHIERTPELADLRRFLINNLRNNRIPARLDDDVPVMHKTGSLETVCNDAGIIYAPQRRIALAYFCEEQADTVLTSVDIADSALRVVEILTGPPR
jgi:beta-lactamase class A